MSIWVGAIYRKRAEKRESEFESMKPWQKGEGLREYKLRTGRPDLAPADAEAFGEYQETLAQQTPDEPDLIYKLRSGREPDPARPIAPEPNDKRGSLSRKLRTGLQR